MRVLQITEIQRGRTCITAACAIEDLRFHATVWYDDLDLDALASRYGEDLLERLALHVALFQLDAVVSLAPDVVDLGAYAHLLTPELAALWQTIVRHVWAQWRWEHDRQDHRPAFASEPVGRQRAVAVPKGPTDLLAFCGGGKDSLVALRLLDRADLSYATLGYAHSIYGPAAPQHALLERVARVTGRVRAERQWVIDDVLDAPIVRTRPELGVRSLLAAETPASVFAALPLALARGYHGLVVAHEASANTPNLQWRGEPVNHQWGKSWEAEQLIDRYVQHHLLANVRYFSVLAPVHDEVIFELLSRDAELAPLTHSCNVHKPWCGRCAKCVYVWLQFAAHLPPAIVWQTFGQDLGERPENEPHLRALLGLAEHRPFECVGSVPEARLAAVLARERGVLGPRASRVVDDVGRVDVASIARPLVEVGRAHGMPAAVAARVVPQLDDAARSAARRLGLG